VDQALEHFKKFNNFLLNFLKQENTVTREATFKIAAVKGV
jgi:hypothetical protein